MTGQLALVKNEDGWNLPPLDSEQGTEFGWADRMFYGFADGKVFDYADWEARDLERMIKKDYQSRKIEAVLTFPIMGASHKIAPAKGDSGEAEWLTAFWETDELNGGCDTPLQQIIDQMTSAFMFKRAYFNKVWTRGQGDFEGKVVYSKLGWRPQTTCRLMRDAKTGALAGFQQEPYYAGPDVSSTIFPYNFDMRESYIYIHGTRRDPIQGISDLEIPYWAYMTKQKILFLWFQFLEGVSLPRTTVKARDPENAKRIAQDLSRVKSSGVLPIDTGGGDPKSIEIDTLDLSGKGADQFQAAITWLDGAATNSVLAGFLDLAGAAANGLRGGGGGSYALSKDASDFFLRSLESKVGEMEKSLRRDLFAPIIRYNFGPKSRVPAFAFEPLNAEDKSAAVALLQTMLGVPASPGGTSQVPVEFTAALAAEVADYIGMDATNVESQFIAAGKAAQAAALKASQQAASQLGQQTANMAGQVNKAGQMVKDAQNGKIPSKGKKQKLLRQAGTKTAAKATP